MVLARPDNPTFLHGRIQKLLIPFENELARDRSYELK